MVQQKNLFPEILRPLGRLPSFFDETDEWFPGIVTFSNERGLSISENKDSILVEAAVPGLKSDDIEISLDKGTLWVKGKKTEEEKDKNRKYYKKAVRSYSYCTSLPENVDTDAEPKATCEDGVVRINFAKKEVSEPKKIRLT